MKLTVAIALLCGISPSLARTIRSSPNGVPGSGYGCSNTCGGPTDKGVDVYYTIRASLETYEVSNSKGGLPNFPDDIPSNEPVSMFTRTFTGVKEESSPFCNGGDDGTTGALGPCLQVLPGQIVKIRLINDMVDGMDKLKQHETTISEYWKLASEPGQPNLDSITWFGPTPETPGDMFVTNDQDIPGRETSFDNVNLHFHGLQIVPHLFFPQGTNNPTAPWITVTADDSDTRCFCYVFEIPSDHPQGTFFWHIHRHGSVAMQAWQGMVGFLQIGNVNSPGSPDNDLAKQGVIRDEFMALWEWSVDPKHRVPGTSTFFEGNFIQRDEYIQTFLTNNGYQPTYSMFVGETVHIRLLCAQTTTGSGIYFLDEDNNMVPFWVFASDGISYSKAVQHESILIGPGQREGVLVQFAKAGKYTIMQQILADVQVGGNVGGGDPSPVGFIEVSSNIPADYKGVQNIDISTLNFTPGMSGDISDEDVINQNSINFEVQSILGKAPVPQFVINGVEFDVSRIVEREIAAVATSWTLTSNMNYFHPFHIHVNPFQVIMMHTGNITGTVGDTSLKDAVFKTNLNPHRMWRDTVFIPPFGMTVIRQRFGESIAWTGKTVFHCHFLDHEDQGMIAAMMIVDPTTKMPTRSPTKRSSKSTKVSKVQSIKNSISSIETKNEDGL